MTEGNDVSPNRDKSNTLIMEAVAILIDTISFDKIEWDALSQVVGFSAGVSRSGGYAYSGEKHKAWTPKGKEFLEKIADLRATMPSKDGRYWHKALIQVTKSDLDFTINVEYDDESRWGLKVKSLDQIIEYANSLRPK